MHESAKNTMDTNLRMLPNSIPRECSTDTMVGLLTYRSHILPSQFCSRPNMPCGRVGCQPPVAHRIRCAIANHSSGSVQESHLLPKPGAFTNCGAKVVEKNDIRKF